MLVGFAFLITTGLAWAFFGVLLSYTARNRINELTLLGPLMGMALVMVLCFVPDYGALAGGIDRWTLALIALLAGAGILNAVGILTLQRAMRSGHNGVSWAIGQSALILPFLTGVIFFKEPLHPIRVIGVAAILASLVAFGMAQEGHPSGGTDRGPRHWFMLALTALFILGLSQTMVTLPSHVPGLKDTAQLRVPLVYLGNTVVYAPLWLRRFERPSRRILLMALAGSITGVISTILLFKGLDRLAQIQMLSLGYPVAVTSCILGFALYSILILREACTRWHVAGMVCGLMGVVCVALGR